MLRGEWMNGCFRDEWMNESFKDEWMNERVSMHGMQAGIDEFH